MDLVSYWQRFCVPFIKAHFGRDDDRGATLVEYVLLVALIAVVCIIAISFLGHAASTKFSSVGNNLS